VKYILVAIGICGLITACGGSGEQKSANFPTTPTSAPTLEPTLIPTLAPTLQPTTEPTPDPALNNPVIGTWIYDQERNFGFAISSKNIAWTYYYSIYNCLTYTHGYNVLEMLETSVSYQESDTENSESKEFSFNIENETLNTSGDFILSGDSYTFTKASETYANAPPCLDTSRTSTLKLGVTLAESPETLMLGDGFTEYKLTVLFDTDTSTNTDDYNDDYWGPHDARLIFEYRKDNEEAPTAWSLSEFSTRFEIVTYKKDYEISWRYQYYPEPVLDGTTLYFYLPASVHPIVSNINTLTPINVSVEMYYPDIIGNQTSNTYKDFYPDEDDFTIGLDTSYLSDNIGDVVQTSPSIGGQYEVVTNKGFQDIESITIEIID